MVQNHTIYVVFCTWESKTTINADIFEPKNAKNAIYMIFFVHYVKNIGIFFTFLFYIIKF